ncbi:unnamed protein product, partial [Ectocarpus sp. 12 AP-2014]
MIVATDVAARGLDIPGVDMVFHYRLPNEKASSFVHRSGRTGRAGKVGLNIMLCSNVEDRQLAALEGDYSFKSLRRSPPSGASNVEEMAGEMKQKILSVSAASVRMYEPQAADLLMKLGLSVAEQASPEGTGGVAADRTVPLEGVQALSAAMSLIGGDSGVSAEFINNSMMRPSVMRYRLCEGGLLVDVPASSAEERIADITARLADMEASGSLKRTFQGIEVSIPLEVAGALDNRGG